MIALHAQAVPILVDSGGDAVNRVTPIITNNGAGFNDHEMVSLKKKRIDFFLTDPKITHPATAIRFLHPSRGATQPAIAPGIARL